MSTEKIKIQTKTSSGRSILIPVTIERRDGQIYFTNAPYSMKNEIKAMRGSRWLGYEDEPLMQWSVEDAAHEHIAGGLEVGAADAFADEVLR